MKLAFISDIHGNATALEAVLKDIDERNINKIFILGDICFRGSEPQRSLDIVRSLNVDVIKGNADEWLVRGIQDDEVPITVHSMMERERDWTVSKLNEESVNYLKNLPTQLTLKFDGIKIHAFHSTPTNLFDVVQPDDSDSVFNEKIMTSDANLYVYGHIHKPFIRFVKGKCVVNSGSVGLPFDGLNKASYALIDIEGTNVDFSIIRIDYEVERVVKQFLKLNYPNKEMIINMLENSAI